MTPYRAGIVGCGRIAGGYDGSPAAPTCSTHAQAYRRCPRTTLVAVCDSDPVRLAGFAATWNVPRLHADLDPMLAAERLDLLSVCTPTDTHAPLVLRAAAHPAPPRLILCEKPIADTADDAWRMVRACEERGIVLAVNHLRRWEPRHREVKRALVEGRLGAVEHVVVRYSRGLAHSGVHHVDLLLDWFGSPLDVMASGVAPAPGDDPNVDLVFRFPGFTAAMLGVDSPHFAIGEIDVVCEAGRVRLSYTDDTIEWFRPAPADGFPGFPRLVPDRAARTELASGLGFVIEQLAGVLADGVPPLSTGRDAVAGLEWIERGRAAAQEACARR